ncbi:cupin domain-containing carboxymuconolactone decarboxylase family protein [Neptuniibacter halophilus]|uniref:cupin domain-containing carboxymuconolactone decarboxylase family protein n=1 Tax=Neptuniibacter halophilus TaxID=651666 RepID=UPI002572F02F|nr:carboxymuconolactone decarboxylase family protein [Neptuniibacter halophilus]
MKTKDRPFLKKLLMTLSSSLALIGPAQATEAEEQSFYPVATQKSFAGPDHLFTGQVDVDLLFPETPNTPFSGAYVHFEPGARSAWHLHPAGQHLVVTKGTALTGTRDGKVIAAQEGDAIWCPPDIDHWHGATPHSAMTHLVITGSKDEKNVIWKELVDDATYAAAAESQRPVMPAATTLTERQQWIIPIAAHTASGNLPQLKQAITEGLAAGLSVNEIKEIQIHLYAYSGFPRALNGLYSFMQLMETRQAQGIKDELGPEFVTTQANLGSLEKGLAVQTQMAGRPVTGPLFDFAPAINTFLQAHLFGDLFARDLLDYKDRELATLGALSGIAGAEAQLKAHMHIATNAGLTEAQLKEVIAVIQAMIGNKQGTTAADAFKAAFAG